MPEAPETVGVILPAAGQGRRLGGADKAFLPLGGQPLVAWAVEVFQACPLVSQIALVLRDDSLEVGRRLAQARGWSKVRVVGGGARRQDSVLRGISALQGCPWVMVHDGARPLVDEGILLRGLEAARETGAAVAVMPAQDTIKEVGAEGWVKHTPDRSRLFLAQTPQVFRRELLEEAHRRAGETEATDDASLVEQAGFRVKAFPGSPYNIKVTTPEDLSLAELLLQRRRGPSENAMRVGMGYDIHPLTPGRRLILGGVEIPFLLGLLGHSDADVLCHAVMDALLGAAGLPDIGVHFPSDDPRYEGASSIDLLRQVGEKVASLSYKIGNIDATVIAQEPRLSPHIPEMRRRLSEALALRGDQIGIKATTPEGLLFAETGMAAYAVALLSSELSREAP